MDIKGRQLNVRRGIKVLVKMLMDHLVSQACKLQSDAEREQNII